MSRIDRLRHLMPLWTADFSEDPASRKRLICMIEETCRAERARALAGHWTYDASRHAALVRVLHLERKELLANL